MDIYASFLDKCPSGYKKYYSLLVYTYFSEVLKIENFVAAANYAFVISFPKMDEPREAVLALDDMRYLRDLRGELRNEAWKILTYFKHEFLERKDEGQQFEIFTASVRKLTNLFDDAKEKISLHQEAVKRSLNKQIRVSELSILPMIKLMILTRMVTLDMRSICYIMKEPSGKTKPKVLSLRSESARKAVREACNLVRTVVAGVCRVYIHDGVHESDAKIVANSCANAEMAMREVLMKLRRAMKDEFEAEVASWEKSGKDSSPNSE